METKYALTIGIVVLTGILIGWGSVGEFRGIDVFQDRDNMKRG